MEQFTLLLNYVDFAKRENNAKTPREVLDWSVGGKASEKDWKQNRKLLAAAWEAYHAPETDKTAVEKLRKAIRERIDKN